MFGITKKMRFGIVSERGKLVLIPYPFTDLSTNKSRPVLILTEPDQYGDFIALPVTSLGYHKYSLPLDGNLQEGSLPKQSWVRTDHIVTLNLSLVIKSFAICDTTLLDKVMIELCSYIKTGAIS